jgi:endonuclease III
MENRPHMLAKLNIDRIMEILISEYQGWKAPVVTLIASRGASPFEVLVSTVLSLRTKDEVTIEASNRLFSEANTPEGILRLDEGTLQRLIYPVGFYPTKSKQILQISHLILEKFNGIVPDDLDALLTLPGVGRKTANLVLLEGFDKDAVCVDTHVHRISNRLGYVQTKSAEETEFALRKKLPRKYWKVYNKLLVAFGQVICRPVSPFCSRCPVASMCSRIGVTKSR